MEHGTTGRRRSIDRQLRRGEAEGASSREEVQRKETRLAGRHVIPGVGGVAKILGRLSQLEAECERDGKPYSRWRRTKPDNRL